MKSSVAHSDIDCQIICPHLNEKIEFGVFFDCQILFQKFGWKYDNSYIN